MCPRATFRSKAGYALAILVLALPAWAQNGSAPATAFQLDWRPVGNWALEAATPVGLASGPVDRVWFGADGASLYVRLSTGTVLQTIDFEVWKAAANVAAPPVSQKSARNWAAMTQFKGSSIIGGDPTDAAISPVDADDFVLANQHGLWRSLDGGESWTSLNGGLPNFPGKRILATPGTDPTGGARVLLDDGVSEARWRPGERTAWTVQDSAAATLEERNRVALENMLGGRPSRVTVALPWVYAGLGQSLMVSSDSGTRWQSYLMTTAAPGTEVAAFYVVPGNPDIALAAMGGVNGTRLVRTMNGGRFWDDMTANLPSGRVYGVTADLETGTIYAATQAGLFVMTANLRAAAPASVWTKIDTGSDAAVLDVALGTEGHQLWILLDRIGLRRTLAPHRMLAPKIVSSADGTTHAGAPGGLLSVLGAKIATARVGTVNVPVLKASETETQLQLPYSVSGGSLTLALQGDGQTRNVAVALQETAPAIFTDDSGGAVLLDADRGVLIDAATPARPGSTVQILASGLGRVTPEWPAGMAAPATSMPKVVAPVRVWLDRVPVDVKRATLAPNYIGLYLVEIEVPALVNSGPNELYLEMAQSTSNRVTLHVAR